MQELLRQANIPESWWPNCYIADNGMIFTPVFDDAGGMQKTGEQAYREWLKSKDIPPVTAPTKADILGKQIAEMLLGGL